MVRGGPRDDPLVTRPVPKKWIAHERAIETAQKRFARGLLSNEFVESSSLVSSEKTIGGLRLSQIKVDISADAPASVEDSIPDSLETAGVPTESAIRESSIVTDRTDANLELGSCKATQHPRPFHGGLGTKVDGKESGTVQFGSAGFRIYHKNDGEHYMMTANHVVAKGYNCSGGKDIEVRDWNNDTIGYGDENNVEHDWIIVSENDNYSDKIVTNGTGHKQTVDGYMTDNGLKTAQQDSMPIESFGNTTGNTQGFVKERGKYTNQGCVFFNFSGVKISADFANGDSGGPIWADWDGTTSVIGVNSVLNPTDTYTDCIGNEYDLSNYVITYGVWRVVNNNPYSIGKGVKNP